MNLLNEINQVIDILGLPSLIISLWALYRIAYMPFRLRLAEKGIKEENIRRERIWKACTELMAGYYSRALVNEPVPPKEVSNLYQNAQNLMLSAGPTSSSISNLSSLLFRFFALLNKQYTKAQTRVTRTSSIRSTSVYRFFLTVLEHIRAESEMPAPYPSFWQILLGREIDRRSKVTKEFKKFINPSSSNFLAFMEQGVRISPYNLESITFMDSAISTNDDMIMVSAYRAIGEHGVIERLLYSRKIYFPPIITLPIEYPGAISLTLDMIGFRSEIQWHDNQKIIRFFYTPRITGYGLPVGINPMEDERFRLSRDILLNKDFDPTGSIIDITINDESMVLRYLVQEEFCRDLFRQNSADLERCMIDQIKTEEKSD